MSVTGNLSCPSVHHFFAVAVIGASAEASSQDILFYDYMDEYDYSSSQIAFDTVSMRTIVHVCELVELNFS